MVWLQMNALLITNSFEYCAFEENLTVFLHIHKIENRRETESVMYLIKIISVLLFLCHIVTRVMFLSS